MDENTEKIIRRRKQIIHISRIYYVNRFLCYQIRFFFFLIQSNIWRHVQDIHQSNGTAKIFFYKRKACMITKLWCIEWQRFRLKVNLSFLTKYLIEMFATNIAREKWPLLNVVDAQFDHHIKILNNFTYILLRSALPRYGNHDKQLR